jgi:hypothetical protein
MDDALVLHSIGQSNLPPEKKSLIRRWYDQVTGGVSSLAAQRVSGHVRETGHVIRSGGEALITGAALGMIDADMGLDVKGVPIDGLVAGAGFLACIYMAHDPYGICADMRNIGSDALTVLSYRKSKAWRERGKAIVAHGESVDDPIALAARDL